VVVDDGLYDRMLKLAGLARSRGWLSDMVVVALDEWCKLHETSASVDEKEPWLDQLMEKTTKKPRRHT